MTHRPLSKRVRTARRALTTARMRSKEVSNLFQFILFVYSTSMLAKAAGPACIFLVI